MMKIAYLIMAHGSPDHFHRLVHALRDQPVFVHIDLKSDMALFQTPGLPDSVVFIKQRVVMSWGGYSLVEATLALLAQALENNPAYDYYALLSGTDYLLRSPAYIEDYVEQHRGAEFIGFGKVSAKPLGRLNVYHVEPFYHDVRCNIIQRMRQRIGYLVHKIRRIWHKVAPRNYMAAFQNKNIFCGSEWWVLSHAAAQYIIKFIAGDPKFLRFLKHSYISDEIFFQTILGNSKFKDSIVGNLTFMDWLENVCHPETITHAYIQEFVKRRSGLADEDRAEYLFARKFPNDSASLVKAIHEKLW